MKKLFSFALLALFLVLPLAAQTPTQQIKVFVTAYSINAAAMSNFQGCQVGDTGCSTGLYICDEANKCEWYTAGAHSFTFNFVRNGGTEAGQTTPVASASIQVAVQ